MTTVPCLDEQPTSIQCLHPEILAEVFKFCLPGNQIGIKYAPLLLCNVCSSWRAIAISTPLLWTHINLSYESLADYNVEFAVDGIHTWLGRSGILPLTIRLRFHELEKRVDNASKISNALSKYASRWEYLDVLAPEVPFASWPTLHAVPLLRTLHVRSNFDGLPFTSSPCLTRITLPLSYKTPSAVMASIPWHQLVEVTITEWQNYGNILRLIAWCPLLETLKVQIFDPDWDVGVEPLVRDLPLEHTVLKDIDISIAYDYYAVLEILTMPALTSLSLYDESFYENRNYSRGYSNLVGLFNRSHCKLQELYLHNCGFSMSQLVESLQHRSCRTLTSLCIETGGLGSQIPDNDDFLLRLTFIEDKVEEFLFPELTHLALHSDCTWKISPGLVGRMVVSRLRRTERSRLKSFQYYNASFLSAEDVSLLKDAEGDGLQVRLNGGP